MNELLEAAPTRTLLRTPAVILASNHQAGNGEARDLRRLSDRLSGRIPHVVVHGREGGNLQDFADQVCRTAARSGATVFVHGGDGTANAFVNAAQPQRVCLGLLPGGTFNYAARGLGIDADPERALEQLLRAAPRELRVGTVNGRRFLVNLSLGLHYDLIEAREALSEQLGRTRLAAILAGFRALGGRKRRLPLELAIDDQPQQRLRIAGLYLSANPILRERMARLAGVSTRRDGMAVVALRRASTWGMVQAAMAMILGRTRFADRFDFWPVRSSAYLRPLPRCGAQIEAVLDGETTRLETPLRVEYSERITLLAPEADD